jgi:hypothetical protein
MTGKMTKFASALVMLVGLAEAAIIEDGLWTNNDWYDDTAKMGV